MLKIFVALRNADMTEGRGPMVPDKYFTERKFAENYIDTKPGVMGRKSKRSTEKYGDLEVEEIEVYDYDIIDEEVRKQKIKEQALNKLSLEERKVLGL